MDLPAHKKVEQSIEILLDTVKGRVTYDDNGDIPKRIMISPDYLSEFISKYCLENIDSIMRLYDQSNRLYKNSQNFISNFIANIIDDDERHMFYDFMFNTEKLQEKIIHLNKEDEVPYLKEIHGFKLEVMAHELRDRWQAIIYIDGIDTGVGLDIYEKMQAVDMKTFQPIEI